MTFSIQQALEAFFSNTGGNGVWYGGTGQSGDITGNVTGGGGTGSSYGNYQIDAEGNVYVKNDDGQWVPAPDMTVPELPDVEWVTELDQTITDYTPEVVITDEGAEYRIYPDGAEYITLPSGTRYFVHPDGNVYAPVYYLNDDNNLQERDEWIRIWPLPPYLIPNGGAPHLPNDDGSPAPLDPVPPAVDPVPNIIRIKIEGESGSLVIAIPRLVVGTSGNDVLTSSGVLNGGAGDDLLKGGAGADTLIGGDGFDMASYENADSTVYASLVGNVAAMDRIVGIEGLIGSAFGDQFIGDANANRLDGRGGADMLDGGAGSDTLQGGSGDDALKGGAGADLLNSGSDNDWLDGGAGADTIDGGAGWDVASYQSATSGVTVDLTSHANGGAAAGDMILNVEVLQGSNHNDMLTGIDNGNGHGVQLYGEGGDDGLVGKGGGDYLFGGAGNDWLDGGAGGDVLDGGEGWDVLSYQSATSGVAVDLTGNANGGAAAGDAISNIEVVQGSNFDDSLVGVDRGGGHGVELHGEGGNDNMRGAAGGDRLYGGAGNDWIAGLAGSDLVEGGAGNDIVGGQEGNDTLNGGAGSDELWGGSGADMFLFNTALGAGVDQLKDFAAEDVIVLDHNVFTGLSLGLGTAGLKYGTVATSTSQHILYDQGTGALSYDVDGSGSQVAVQFAKLAAGMQMSAYQFLVI
jgi:Ca2+-binding RTX toxin-like protein